MAGDKEDQRTGRTQKKWINCVKENLNMKELYGGHDKMLATFHSLPWKTTRGSFPFFQFLSSCPFLSYIPLQTT
jgi:hypothetical protein